MSSTAFGEDDTEMPGGKCHMVQKCSGRIMEISLSGQDVDTEVLHGRKKDIRVVYMDSE